MGRRQLPAEGEMMSRLTNELLAAGGLVGCCAAAVQVSQLLSGHAAHDAVNLVITGLTAFAGLGLTAGSLWQRRRTRDVPPDDQALLASLDRLFVSFAGDDAAQETVRAVARAITERRYRGGEG